MHIHTHTCTHMHMHTHAHAHTHARARARAQVALDDGGVYVGQTADGRPHGLGVLRFPGDDALGRLEYAGQAWTVRRRAAARARGGGRSRICDLNADKGLGTLV